MAYLARICRYPVKSMSVEDLDRVTLTPGETLPDDRRFAIARGSAGIDPTEPSWVPRDNFVTLVRTDKLAQLQTGYDSATGELTIHRGKRQVAKGKVTEPTGRTVIDQFLAAFLEGEVNRTPKLIDGGRIAMTDDCDPTVSIINVASVRDLERVAGHPVDPDRFRGNLLIEGLDPWVERSWLNQHLQIGGTRIKLVEPVERCGATNVNPATGQRDANIPKLLQRGYGHIECGMYGRVVAGGEIHVNDTVVPPDV
jgi:hypothetical protein